MSERIELQALRTSTWLLIATFALFAVMAVSVTLGAVGTSTGDIVALFGSFLGVSDASSVDPVQQVVLTNIRIPRILLTLFVGAGLGVAGVALQGLFRNPLADPALIGVSSGAALAASAVIVFESSLAGSLLYQIFGTYSISVAAFCGSLCVSLIVLRLASVQGKTDVSTLLLAGIAINAIAQAGTGLLTYLSDDTQMRTLTFWLMGSLGSADWSHIKLVGPFVLLGIIVLSLHSRALNAIMLGESAAEHLGFHIQRTKLLIVVTVSLCVGAAVALTGIIGFIGLVVPHIVRLLAGPNHNRVFPLSALVGAAVLLLADMVSRTVVAPAELPIGIVTSLFGGPFFLWLLLQRNARRAKLL